VKLRVFTLVLDATSGRFDDSEVVAFFAEREALAVSEHFFIHDRRPTLALLVQYRDRPTVPATERKGGGTIGPGGARRAPALDVAEADQPLFQALRKWRNDRAKRDGRPAYVLFTNAQLGAIASSRPETRVALGSIEGIGEARVRDYADDVLALVASVPPHVPDEGERDGADGA